MEAQTLQGSEVGVSLETNESEMESPLCHYLTPKTPCEVELSTVGFRKQLLKMSQIGQFPDESVKIKDTQIDYVSSQYTQTY